ncbi:hypothetical protein BaRGS_00028486 [Batillaria attramentaria]|uniref:Uncharacterized protein n=1 Tax=Batillaria attramentaria TaxID=370345 RepID=A0ABD0JZJ2_9CAEN
MSTPKGPRQACVPRDEKKSCTATVHGRHTRDGVLSRTQLPTAKTEQKGCAYQLSPVKCSPLLQVVSSKKNTQTRACCHNCTQL